MHPICFGVVFFYFSTYIKIPLLPAVNRVSSWQTNSNTGLISNSDLINNVKLTTANKLSTRIWGKSCNVYQE